LPEIAYHIKEILAQIPELPGIYKFYNADGVIIYIGKSKCLRKRVKSYFVKTPKWEKVKKLVCFIHDIEYIVTDTHLEARLLECELIKAIKPHFNSQMKNDQRYVFLKVADFNPYNPFAVIQEREEDSFGPFRSSYTLLDIIDSFKNLYPIWNPDGTYQFEYHLLPVKLDRAAFAANRACIMDMLTDTSKIDLFVQKLEVYMTEAAALYKFEMASRYRDIISGFRYIKYGISAYQNLAASSILLNIPCTDGCKLFYVSDGTIRLKEKFLQPPGPGDIKGFIKKGKAQVTRINLSDKMQIDFRDVLYSEITALPEDMVTVL
jgi:excinuclease ABC subunit C